MTIFYNTFLFDGILHKMIKNKRWALISHVQHKEYFHTPVVFQYYCDVVSDEYLINKTFVNTPGTAGGPGGRDRTLAVVKNRAKMTFFSGGKKITQKKYFFFAYIF